MEKEEHGNCVLFRGHFFLSIILSATTTWWILAADLWGRFYPCAVTSGGAVSELPSHSRWFYFSGSAPGRRCWFWMGFWMAARMESKRTSPLRHCLDWFLRSGGKFPVKFKATTCPVTFVKSRWTSKLMNHKWTIRFHLSPLEADGYNHFQCDEFPAHALWT